jgi:hypothetical protein
MEEIWVPSTFCVETFARSGVDLGRLRVVPSPLEPLRVEEARRRARRAARETFRFVTVHDGTRRHGLDLLVAAFVNEFASSPQARLRVLHQGRALADPQAEREKVLRLARNAAVRGEAPLDRIEFRGCAREAIRLAQLAAAGAFVHPFRGDGLGRETLEACALGVPVIATRYGAVLDFLHDRNAFLLDCALLAADGEGAGRDPTSVVHRWAEPLTVHLAELMRRVFEDAQERGARAARAREDVAASHGVAEVAGRLRRAVVALSAPGAIGAQVLREVAPEDPPLPGSAVVEGHGLCVSWAGRFSGDVEHLGRPLASRVGGAGIRVATGDERGGGGEPAELRVVGAVDRWESYLQRPWIAVVGEGAEEVQPIGIVDADEIWTPWHSVRDRLLAEGVDSKRVAVLPPPVDEETFSETVRPAELPTSRRLRFLYLGDATRAGGLDHLLTAFAAAFTERDDATLVVATTGAELEEGMASRLLLLQDTPGSPEVLRLDPATSPIERARLYAACDVLVLPCRDERASLPLVEAMLVGRPAVHPEGIFGEAEPRGSFPVAATKRACAGKGGLGPAWTLEVDTTALARTLQSIFLDPARLPARGGLAREWAQAWRSWLALVRRARARLVGLASVPAGATA